MSLIIYDSNKTNLSPVSFINDIRNQTAIRDLDTNSENFKKQLGFIFSKVSNLLGVKQTILDINKRDIVDLLNMRFKGISLDEVDYAFKLERYGSLGTKTDHFQLINADYVSTVLDKYKSWKVFQLKNVVKKVIEKEQLSDNDKEIRNKKIVLEFLERYKENPFIEEYEFYIYDILDKKGLMPTDIEYKNQVKKDAISLLEMEYSQKKAKSKDEFKDFQRELQMISLGKGGLVKQKCKILVLEEFFRDLFKDHKKVIEFKKKLNK